MSIYSQKLIPDDGVGVTNQTMQLVEYRECRTLRSDTRMLEEATLFWEELQPGSVTRIGRSFSESPVVAKDLGSRSH